MATARFGGQVARDDKEDEGLGMTGGRGSRDNRDSGLPHPGVEGEGLGFSDADFSESGMGGIEQIVLFLGNDGRGHGQNRRLSLFEPAGADLGERFGGWIFSPAARQSALLYRCNRKLFGHLGGDRDEVLR